MDMVMIFDTQSRKKSLKGEMTRLWITENSNILLPMEAVILIASLAGEEKKQQRIIIHHQKCN
jgi:hypothetical protein